MTPKWPTSVPKLQQPEWPVSEPKLPMTEWPASEPKQEDLNRDLFVEIKEGPVIYESTCPLDYDLLRQRIIFIGTACNTKDKK